MPYTVAKRRRSDPGLAAAGAVALRDRLATGALRAAELAEALLDRIAESEPEVRAWAWHDPEHVRGQARTLDSRRAARRPCGPLHGLPVGVKDIIDTAGIPTENGTPLDAGRVPTRDAGVVSRLKAAGAMLMGKTATCELAFLHPAPTRNPSAPGRTPGGSSAGSAAAVAAGHVPFAVGTQTGGSVIRPAAYCGIVGFKPSFGLIGRSGILSQSPSLDTVGVFARSVTDAALLAEALAGHDPADPATSPDPTPALSACASSSPPVRPTLAFVPPPRAELADEIIKSAFAELRDALGDSVFTAALPAIFEEAPTVRDRINFAEMAKAYYAYERRGGEALSPELRAALEAGKALPARDYLAALDWPAVLNAGLSEIFDRSDAILTYAAPGPAPEGLGSTGSSVFNGLWTLTGLPAVTLPLLQSEAGLPIGVQLVGRQGDDGRLLRTANWLLNEILGPEAGGDAA